MSRTYRTIISSHLIQHIDSKTITLTKVIISEPFNTSESYRKYNYNLFHPTQPGGEQWSELCHPLNPNPFFIGL